MGTKNIINQVKRLMKQLEVPKVKLGAVLGGKTNEPKGTKYARAERFLKENKKGVSVEELERICRFFDKPKEFFLYGSEGEGYLASDDAGIVPDPKGEKEVRAGLLKMGFDLDFVEKEIKKLNAKKEL